MRRDYADYSETALHRIIATRLPRIGCGGHHRTVDTPSSTFNRLGKARRYPYWRPGATAGQPGLCSLARVHSARPAQARRHRCHRSTLDQLARGDVVDDEHVDPASERAPRSAASLRIPPAAIRRGTDISCSRRSDHLLVELESRRYPIRRRTGDGCPRRRRDSAAPPGLLRRLRRYRSRRPSRLTRYPRAEDDVAAEPARLIPTASEYLAGSRISATRRWRSRSSMGPTAEAGEILPADVRPALPRRRRAAT